MSAPQIPVECPQYPQIKAEFEALHLKDGSLLFNSTRGRHVHIKNPPFFSKPLLALCIGEKSISEIENELTGADPNLNSATLRSYLTKLTSSGLISESLWSICPTAIGIEEMERFRNEISYFQCFETPKNSAYDFFQRLREAKVTIIGAGGNGSLLAVMLAAAGVGKLHIVDGDVAETSNLVRQIFYTEVDCKEKVPKVLALKNQIAKLTHFTKVTTTDRYMSDQASVSEEIRDSTCVILCADMPRFVINRWVNDACFEKNIPYINAFAGIIGPFTVPGESPCFNCFEKKMKAQFLGLYDQIVESLQQTRAYPYPSFVGNVAHTAQIQFREVIHFLTGIADTETLKGVLHLRNGNYELEKYEKSDFCARCVSLRDSSVAL